MNVLDLLEIVKHSWNERFHGLVFVCVCVCVCVYIYIYIYIWLSVSLVAAHGLLSCHMWTVSGSMHVGSSSLTRIEPGPPALECGVLSIEPPGKSQDPYLETLHHPHPHLFFISTISFMISLIGSVVNPVKPCTTSGHSFCQQEFIVLGLMAFTAFSITKMSSSVV